MKHTVLIGFSDQEDNGHVYWPGMLYPRDRYEPSQERINTLSGCDNRQKRPLIAAMQEPANEAKAQSVKYKKHKPSV